jgi:ubiquinone/menaquinone biosynthesis C-methylase UbiE
MSLHAHLEALLGLEGRQVTRAELARFYTEQYLRNNPTLDATDALQKAERLLEVCRRGGVEKARSVLEVGCGSGVLLEEMARCLGASRIVGVDYSPSIAKVAGKVQSVIVAADGLDLPFPDKTFDLAYFADVLEHVLDPGALLREVGRVARRIAFLVPMEAGLIASPIYALRRARGKPTNYEQYGHIWRWTRPQLERLFHRSGVEIEAMRLHHATLQLEGMNRMGKVLERVRHTLSWSAPLAAEALFGSVAYVALGHTRASTS